MPHSSETRIQRGLGKVQSLARSFANVTPESHAKKVAEAQQLAAKTKIEGKQTVYEALDAKSISETMKFSAGIGGVIGSGILGLAAYTSSFENGDVVKATVGLGLLALATRCAKTPIRAVDNANAIEEVIIETSGMR